MGGHSDDGSDDGSPSQRGLAGLWAGLKPYLPPVNFITLHHAYFIFGGLAAAALFYAVSTDRTTRTLSFVDAWFLIVSAFTASGLNTVNLSELATGQQVILCLMTILGSPVLVSLFTIWYRYHIFEKRFDHIVKVERERRRRGRATGTMVGMAGAMFGLPVMSSFGAKKSHAQRAAQDAFELSKPQSREHQPHHQHHHQQHQRHQSQNSTATTRPPSHLQAIREEGRFQKDAATMSSSATVGGGGGGGPAVLVAEEPPMHRMATRQSRNARDFNFHSFLRENKTSIGRNGQFFDLDDDQREYLGGVEYRALKLLFVIIAVYFVALQFLGAIALGAWLSVHSRDVTAVNAQDPWWAGIFLGISAFNNAGLTLLDAGIAAFADDAFVLIVVTFLALAGNSFFPACIRVAVRLGRLVLQHGICRWAANPDDYDVWLEAFDFILKYPRRLFMLMFPSKANWAFVAFFSSLVVVDWVCLLVFSIGNDVLEALAAAPRVGIALFQAAMTNGCGLAIFAISGLWFDVQVLLLIIMYLAAYPEIIVMRNSNVYEERSLGLYTSAEAEKQDDEEEEAEARGSLDELVVSSRGPLMSPTRGHFDPRFDAMSLATGVSQAPSVKMLSQVGRRGTQFVGRQIQKRLNFQGVGVDAPAAAPRLKRARLVHFDDAPQVAQEGGIDLVSQHLRGQLSHDIWSIAAALLLVTLIETSHSIADPRTYSVFTCLFEIVSGYTNIGLSVGLPDSALSFSGGLYPGSKIVMILMMIRGRHRGLPVALDHSVKLPGWDNARTEEEDAQIRRTISRARASAEL